MIALPADLRASIPEVCPLSGQVDSPDLRLRGERQHGEARAGQRLRPSGESRRRGDADKLSCECVDVSGSTEGSGWNTYRAAPDLRACPDNLQGEAELCRELTAPP